MKIKSFYTTLSDNKNSYNFQNLGRQVFVGIPNNYPLERFENDKVQLV